MNSESEPVRIDLASLGTGMPGLTTACATTLVESAAVCLEDRKHTPGAVLRLAGIKGSSYALQWSPVDDQQRRCYNDLQEATERGACGIAILLIHEVTGKVVVERSRKGTGFDYWLGDSEDDLLMAGKARLEVSGILDGDSATITKRVKQKKEQMRVTDYVAPGYVGVVEFGAPHAHLEAK